MDAEEFRKRGKEMMDYIATRPVPDVKPGYMKELIRDEAPRDPDNWEDLMKHIEPIIMKGSNASEATLCGFLAARTKVIRRIKGENPSMDDHTIMSILVCYCSDQAHSSLNKAGLIGAVDMRILDSDNDGSLRGSTLEKAVKEGIWMHIDAAYAGSAFICPEFRSYLDGVEDAMSFNFNPHKWLQIHFDCSALWVKDSRLLSEAFVVDSLYLKHENENSMPDYRRTNEINEQLFKLLNKNRRIHLVASVMKGRFYLRFVVCASSTTSEDVNFAWKVIQEITDEMLRNC